MCFLNSQNQLEFIKNKNMKAITLIIVLSCFATIQVFSQEDNLPFQIPNSSSHIKCFFGISETNMNEMEAYELCFQRAVALYALCNNDTIYIVKKLSTENSAGAQNLNYSNEVIIKCELNGHITFIREFKKLESGEYIMFIDIFPLKGADQNTKIFIAEKLKQKNSYHFINDFKISAELKESELDKEEFIETDYYYRSFNFSENYCYNSKNNSIIANVNYINPIKWIPKTRLKIYNSSKFNFWNKKLPNKPNTDYANLTSSVDYGLWQAIVWNTIQNLSNKQIKEYQINLFEKESIDLKDKTNVNSSNDYSIEVKNIEHNISFVFIDKVLFNNFGLIIDFSSFIQAENSNNSTNNKFEDFLKNYMEEYEL